MFKKFTVGENVSGHSQAKTSVQRNIRRSLLESLPALECHLDDLIPKKAPIFVAKCSNHINLIVINKEVLFYQIRDQLYLPTIRLVHKYPDILPKVQVDRGAIRFVLKGADIMCPGLTSAGGRLDLDLPSETCVCIQAEGKQHAIAIGITKLDTLEIRSVNKGIAIENVHYLNDGLWQTTTLE